MESVDMYAAYLEELGGKHLFRNDKGFIIYSFVENNCYVEEVYILPEHRGQKDFLLLYNGVVEIAKQKGCKKLLGSVVPSANGSTKSLNMLISYGAKLVSSSNNFILLEKEVI
jgi:hypothetical protein